MGERSAGSPIWGAEEIDVASAFRRTVRLKPDTTPERRALVVTASNPARPPFHQSTPHAHFAFFAGRRPQNPRQSYNMTSATAASRGVIAAVTTTCVMVWATILLIGEVRRGTHPSTLHVESAA